MHFRVLVVSTTTMPDSKLASLLLPFKTDPDTFEGMWDAWNRIEDAAPHQVAVTLFCSQWKERNKETEEEWVAHVNELLNHRRYGSHAVVDCHI